MPLSHRFPRRYKIKITAVTLVIAVFVLLLGQTSFDDFLRTLRGQKTVQEQVTLYESLADERLKPLFVEKQVAYPPQHVTLLLIKDQKKLYLYAGHNQFNVKYIKTYNVLSASGVSGPRLKRGDRQVPEGIYGVESLNPNSSHHLALRVSYPNEFDLDKAKLDGREDLESDIMIHGSNVCEGCIAIGNDSIEELFVLAAKSEYNKWKLVFAPTDLKTRVRETRGDEPSWISELDQKLLHTFLVLP